MKIIESGVVVIAQTHNPSVLNPDFLKENGIVPRAWVVSETITTPPFSQTRFAEGITISVDSERLNVSEELMLDSFPKASQASKIASEYIRTLQHVKYVAVGFNWKFVIPMADAKTWVVDKYINKDSLPNEQYGLEQCNLIFRFNRNGVISTLQVGAGVAVNDDGKEEAGLLISVNSHYDLSVIGKPITETVFEWETNKDYIKTIIEWLLK